MPNYYGKQLVLLRGWVASLAGATCTKRELQRLAVPGPLWEIWLFLEWAA